MADFKTHFCLDKRDSFTIDPMITESDAKFYFGRDEIIGHITSQLTRGFVDPGVPKILLFGAYGTGKTQTLHHLSYLLQTKPPRSLGNSPHIVYLIVEMSSRSDARDWHFQILEALSKSAVSTWVEQSFSRETDLDKFLASIAQDDNLVSALKNLRGGGDPPLTAWRWLTGQKLSSQELQRLNLTRNLGEVGSGDLIAVLVCLGRLARSNGETLIFLMDELESFANITNADAIESVHNYLRRLAEPQNASAGLILSIYATTRDSMPEIFTRQDVVTRIGNQSFIEIFSFPSVEDVRRFSGDLLHHLVDQGQAEERIRSLGLSVSLETYPFTAEAFELFCDYASQDPARSLPRSIIHGINECAIAAWDDDSPTIEEQTVHDIAPLVFQA